MNSRVPRPGLDLRWRPAYLEIRAARYFALRAQIPTPACEPTPPFPSRNLARTSSCVTNAAAAVYAAQNPHRPCLCLLRLRHGRCNAREVWAVGSGASRKAVVNRVVIRMVRQ